jgi:hypothetical protein
MTNWKKVVIPAEAGIQSCQRRGDDDGDFL